MSLIQVCADVQAGMARARALFGPVSAVEVPRTAAELHTAAEVMGSAQARTAELSGAGMHGYRAAAAALPPLTGAAGSDIGLAGQLGSATAVTQAGAARMDQIEANTTAIANVAPAAVSAPSQRAVLVALRSQVAQANSALGATQQQSSAIASQVRELRYLPTAQVPHPHPPEPEPVAPPVCYTGTEDGPLGQCPQSTTDIIYWDGHGHLLHKNLDTGAVREEFPADEADSSGGPGPCWLPDEHADRSVCPTGTYEWRFPRNGDYVIDTRLLPSDAVQETVIPPGTPLWN